MPQKPARAMEVQWLGLVQKWNNRCEMTLWISALYIAIGVPADRLRVEVHPLVASQLIRPQLRMRGTAARRDVLEQSAGISSRLFSERHWHVSAYVA